jgi:hypothetical protein
MVSHKCSLVATLDETVRHLINGILERIAENRNIVV